MNSFHTSNENMYIKKSIFLGKSRSEAGKSAHVCRTGRYLAYYFRAIDCKLLYNYQNFTLPLVQEGETQVSK